MNSNFDRLPVFFQESIEAEKLKMIAEAGIQKITLIYNAAKLNDFKLSGDFTDAFVGFSNIKDKLVNNEYENIDKIKKFITETNSSLEKIIDKIDLIDTKKATNREGNSNFGRKYIEKGMNSKYDTNNFNFDDLLEDL